jgi:hypothetical protein
VTARGLVRTTRRKVPTTPRGSHLPRARLSVRTGTPVAFREPTPTMRLHVESSFGPGKHVALESGSVAGTDGWQGDGPAAPWEGWWIYDYNDRSLIRIQHDKVLASRGGEGISGLA